MAEPVSVRPLERSELAAYKALRDAVLAADDTAFTSDAQTESAKPAAAYVDRLGHDRPEGGHFTLAAWRGEQLVGAVSCEREARRKARHIGHVHALFVRRDARRSGIGRALLETCIARARAADGLELLTLSVTAGNPAEQLYARLGFEPYGTLRRAIKLGDAYFDKQLMSLHL